MLPLLPTSDDTKAPSLSQFHLGEKHTTTALTSEEANAPFRHVCMCTLFVAIFLHAPVSSGLRHGPVCKVYIHIAYTLSSVHTTLYRSPLFNSFYPFAITDISTYCQYFSFIFLDASSHLYNRLCPLAGWLVGWLVGLSVCW